VAIAAKVEIAFIANPYGTSLSWTDVTSRVVSLKTTSGRNYELGKNESSTVNLVLRNQDGAFNPLNTSSPYAPNVLPFRPVRITAAATGGGPSYPVWYGYVRTWPQSVKDATSQYEIVNLSGVDAFKAVLGFVPGDPYDVKVRKDYGAYVAPGLSSGNWDFYAFDELAAPFASENIANAHPLTIMSGGTGPTKNSPSPCRTALTFNGSQGLFFNNSTYAAGELWLSSTALPSTPGAGQVVITATVGTVNTTVSALYVDGLPNAPTVHVTSSGASAQAMDGIYLSANYTNLMPSDNSASFETSVADWVSETPANVTIAQSAVNPLVGTHAMRATLTAAAGGNIALATRIPVTAGAYYAAQVGVACSTTSKSMNILMRWYNGTGALLSTSSPAGEFTPGITVPAGQYGGYFAGQVAAPAGAASLSIVLVPSLTAGATATFDFDCVKVVSGTPPIPLAYLNFTLPSQGLTVSLAAAFNGATFVAPAPTVGLWYHYAWAPKSVTAAPTVFAINGVAQPAPATDPGGAPATLQGIGALEYNGTYVPGAGLVGQVAGVWFMKPTAGLNAVSATYAAQHYNYGTTGAGAARTHDFSAELTSNRVRDALTAIGFPTSMMALETGLTTMSASGNVSGTTATALLEAAADAELGDVFVDASGIVTFHNGNHRNSPTSVATFGGVGNIPYETSRVVDFDDTYIYNDVQVTQAGASPAYVYEIQDVTSQNTYGVRSLTVSAQVVNQSDVQAMGATLLARYKQPVARLSTLSFELRSKPTYLAQIMALKIGDLITINYAALGGTVYALPVFIDGISHTVDENQWLVSFNTTPLYGTVAPPAPGSYPAVYTATY
jgi:hypothetical protein